MDETIVYKLGARLAVTQEMLDDAKPFRAALDQAYEDLRLYFEFGPILGPPKPTRKRQIVTYRKGRGRWHDED